MEEAFEEGKEKGSAMEKSLLPRRNSAPNWASATASR